MKGIIVNIFTNYKLTELPLYHIQTNEGQFRKQKITIFIEFNHETLFT